MASAMIRSVQVIRMLHSIRRNKYPIQLKFAAAKR